MYFEGWDFNFEYEYLAGIRDDSLRRVYYKGDFLPNNSCCYGIDFSQEILIYDFGGVVDDTIQGLDCAFDAGSYNEMEILLRSIQSKFAGIYGEDLS